MLLRNLGDHPQADLASFGGGMAQHKIACILRLAAILLALSSSAFAENSAVGMVAEVENEATITSNGHTVTAKTGLLLHGASLVTPPGVS
jgi:hypothetical protein